MDAPASLYGLLAEFRDPEALRSAARGVTEAGYRRVDAYTPFPVEGLAEALGFYRSRMPLVALLGGLAGCALGYGLQWWTTAVEYPINVGGRPLHSWPAFVPVTFEVTILVAALSTVLGMLGLNGLPRPHHPLFAIPSFQRASQDGYFLCIEARDPAFHETTSRRLLLDLGALEVIDVPQQP